MVQQVINVGTAPGDHTGDQLRTAMVKINENFSEIYAKDPVGAAFDFTDNTISATNTNGNIELTPNGSGITVIHSNLKLTGNTIFNSSGAALLTISGQDVTVQGNLTVAGATTTIGSTDLTVEDSIINLHTYPNLTPLTADDGRDIGMKMHYYKSSDKHAFLGWANDSGFLEYYSDATETSGVISGTYGTIKAANVFATGGVIYNGTSNLTVAASGNVSVNVGGNSNVLVATSSGNIYNNGNLMPNLVTMMTFNLAF